MEWLYILMPISGVFIFWPGLVILGLGVGIIGGLCEGLDRENSADSVGELNQLYIYMMKRLAEANVKSDPQILDEVAGLLRTVKEGWDGIAPSGPQF